MRKTKCASCGARYPNGKPPGARCTTCGVRNNFVKVTDDEPERTHAEQSHKSLELERVASLPRVNQPPQTSKPLKIAGQDLESIRQLIETGRREGAREIELDIEDTEVGEVQTSIGNLFPVKFELGPIKFGRTRKRSIVIRF